MPETKTQQPQPQPQPKIKLPNTRIPYARNGIPAYYARRPFPDSLNIDPIRQLEKFMAGGPMMPEMQERWGGGVGTSTSTSPLSLAPGEDDGK